MQVVGLLMGARLLDHFGFPASEMLGLDASEGQIQDLIQDQIQVLIDRHR